MAVASPDILVRRGIESGLVATILASAAIHAGLLALLVLLPGRFLKPAPKLESYTVDLVAPNALGGTNLVPAGRAKAPEPAPAVAPKAAAPEPVAVKPVAEAPAQQPGAVEVAPPPKVAEPAKPVEAPKPVEPPQPVAPAPKPAEPPPVAAKPPAVKPVAPPKPVPEADAKPPEAKPPEAKAAPKPAEPPKPVAKPAEPPKPIPPPAAKPAPAVNPPSAEAQKKPAAPAAETADKAAKKRDDAITAAIQRRAAQVQTGSPNAAPDLDKQIAAAVQRRAQQVGQGGGGAGSEPGGPVSIGPGSGAGGTPADLQYILYQGRMEERIKAAWAWAGANKTLHAVIQFNLTPEGEIKNVRTIDSSGDRQYDASCERAVRVVNPLEPIPEKYRKEFATVQMTFKPTDLEQ